MFAFDVSLCEISTFGANEEMQHSLFPPVLSKNVLISKSWVKPAVFLKPTKCWISSKIMQMFQNWVSDICKCFSSLDKNLLPLRSLVLLLLFSKRGHGQNYNLASFTALKDWGSLLEGLGNVSGKVLWKIYNQDNSWHIKRKNLDSSVGFYLEFFHLSFFFGICFIDIDIWSERGGRCLLVQFIKSIFLNINKTI